MALKVSKAIKQTQPHSTGSQQDYSAHLTEVTGTITMDKLTKGVPGPSGVQMSETVHPGLLTDGTKVTVEGGRTINLGNFESARIGVSITIPTTKKDLDDAFEWGSEWVTGKINQATEDVMKLKS